MDLIGDRSFMAAKRLSMKADILGLKVPTEIFQPPTYAEVRGSDPLYGNLCSYADLHGVKPYVAMRVKKGSTVRSQKEESRMRHAMPPSSTVTKVAANRPRPQSTNSYHSLASSGLENVTWRNSSLSINTDSQRRQTRHEDDTSPKMEKMENLLREELQLVQKGMETAQKLCDWYSERLSSLEKRKRLLEQGKVALECAVHEQKLNLLRAHLTELNRRMVSLMETSERGFPFHVNLQVSATEQRCSFNYFYK
ncbi:unnamed protein product [Nippostrongylus brasiliensis]|uniref:SPATA6 domain-containing protein n=1 Tax=Nippostrongylus brasiliensis TaxID=27835 RepID=A0A158QYN3_NIPBR|nr:unnamed protein product [Nippostrongylus brasiliensis]